MDTKKSQDRKPQPSFRKRNKTVKNQYGPDKKPDGSKENMEGGGARCEDTSVTHPVQSDDPDNKNRLDDPHTSSDRDDGDSAVWSKATMPSGIDFSDTHPHQSDSHAEPDLMSLCSEKSLPTGPSFSEDNVDESLINQSEVCKRCEGSCGVCLGNVHHAVKHCKTCSVSYCETHVVDHYKSPAFSSHKLVEYKQTSRETPARDGSLQRSSSDHVVLPELRVMMLGKTGTGKSASGNTILGREAFKSKASASPVTKSCKSQSGVVEGRNITVIDTPAITRKAAWLSEKVDARPHVFLLVILLGRFTEDDGKGVKWIQRKFGEEALKFTIVLFTQGDQMDQKNAEEFLGESSVLKTLVSSTGGGYHIFDNKTPEERGQVKGLLERIELLLRKNMGYSYSYGLHEQVTIAVKEEEKRKRLEMERDKQINDAIKTMEKRIEQNIMEQMELKMINRNANSTATLNELREIVKATTEQGGNSLQEQVKTAVREEEERKRREKLEEEKEEATTEQEGNSLQEQVTTAERAEGATTDQGGNCLIYLVGVVCCLIGLAGLCFLESSQIIKAKYFCLSYLPGVVSGLIGLTGLFFLRLMGVVKATFFCLSYLSGVMIGFIGLWILRNAYE